MNRSRYLITSLVVVQALCMLFFVSELASEVFGLRHWQLVSQVVDPMMTEGDAG